MYTGIYVTLAPIPNEENNHIQAHRRYSIFCPFECDECLFNCITGASSLHLHENHQRILDQIIRTNLDAFWLHKKDTVQELRRNIFEEIELGGQFVFHVFPKPMGPFLPDYDLGVCVTIGILSRSNRPVCHK